MSLVYLHCFPLLLLNALLKDYWKTYLVNVRDAVCRKTLGSICGIALNSIDEYSHELDHDRSSVALNCLEVYRYRFGPCQLKRLKNSTHTVAVVWDIWPLSVFFSLQDTVKSGACIASKAFSQNQTISLHSDEEQPLFWVEKLLYE